MKTKRIIYAETCDAKIKIDEGKMQIDFNSGDLQDLLKQVVQFAEELNDELSKTQVAQVPQNSVSLNQFVQNSNNLQPVQLQVPNFQQTQMQAQPQNQAQNELTDAQIMQAMKQFMSNKLSSLPQTPNDVSGKNHHILQQQQAQNKKRGAKTGKFAKMAQMGKQQAGEIMPVKEAI